MDKGKAMVESVTISRESYDALKESERNIEKIAWGSPWDTTGWHYAGRDEVLTAMQKRVDRAEKQLSEMSKPKADTRGYWRKVFDAIRGK